MKNKIPTRFGKNNGQKPKVVFLGGSSSGEINGRIKRYAKRFKGLKFLEINSMAIKKPKEKNVTIKQGDWLKELNKLKNNSIGNIKSGMSLGYYKSADTCLNFAARGLARDRALIVRYTRAVLWTAEEKLKKNGTISIIVAKEKKQNPYPTNGLRNVLDATLQTSFENNYQVKKIGTKEYPFLDPYEREAMEKEVPLYRVILTKK